MILRLPLLLSVIAGALAVPDEVFYAFTGYGNMLGGGLAIPGVSGYEPLEASAAEDAPQKVTPAPRPASAVTVSEKQSRLRLTRPPPVTVLPTVAAPGTAAVTTFPVGAPAFTFQRPLFFSGPPPSAYLAAPQQVVFQQPALGAAAPAPASGTKTVAAAAAVAAPAAKAKSVTVTTSGAAAAAPAPAAGVTVTRPGSVTVARPLTVTYPSAHTYLFQRPAYALPNAAAGVPAPVQVAYMRPLYTHQYVQPAPVAAPVATAYQRPVLAYPAGATAGAAAPLTVAYPGPVTYPRTLAGAPAVYAAPHVAMPLAAAAPLVSAFHAPVAAMPYSLSRQVIAPFPGTVAVARPQLTYQAAAYAQPPLGAALSYGPAPVGSGGAAAQASQIQEVSRRC